MQTKPGHGRPLLGAHRMVTISTRIEPSELKQLTALADKAGLSLGAYLRELVRAELRRAARRSKR